MKLACTVTMVSLACEQALLFGRGSRERAIEGPLLVPIWSPWEPNLSHRRRGCQLGLLSINFVFRNVIFQPMVFPFVSAKYKWNFMRDRCKPPFLCPSRLRHSLARSRETRFARPNTQIGELTRRLWSRNLQGHSERNWKKKKNKQTRSQPSVQIEWP